MIEPAYRGYILLNQLILIYKKECEEILKYIEETEARWAQLLKEEGQTSILSAGSKPRKLKIIEVKEPAISIFLLTNTKKLRGGIISAKKKKLQHIGKN